MKTLLLSAFIAGWQPVAGLYPEDAETLARAAIVGHFAEHGDGIFCTAREIENLTYAEAHRPDGKEAFIIHADVLGPVGRCEAYENFACEVWFGRSRAGNWQVEAVECD